MQFRFISFCITGSEVHFNSARALIVSYMPEIRQHLETKLLPDVTQTVEQYITNSRMTSLRCKKRGKIQI